MPRKFYTVFILPHAHARFRKLHVSQGFLWTCAAILGLVVVAGALAPHLLLRVRAQSAYLERLERENRRLLQDKTRYDASLAEIGAQLSAIEAAAVRLANAVGLENLPLPRPAGGATEEAVAASGDFGLRGDLTALRNRTEALELSFARIDAAWNERVKLLASTPSLLPVVGYFGDGYGWRDDPFTGQREFHRGLDIVAPHGEPVRAAADGVVVQAGRTAGYGWMVHLSHGYGLGTRYGHLSAVLVRPGERVRKGDVIGRVGSTGRSSGPHLHYEVYRGAAPVNPRAYLSKKGSG